MKTWHQMVEADLRRVLGIPDGVAIAATIPLGKPAGNHGPVRRRPLRELVYDDPWERDAPWAQDPEGTKHPSAAPPQRPTPRPLHPARAGAGRSYPTTPNPA